MMTETEEEQTAMNIAKLAIEINNHMVRAEELKMKVMIKQDANIDYLGEVIPYNVPIKVFIANEYL